MAICSFILENEIYDASLYPVILNTMRAIVEQQDELECYFYHSRHFCILSQVERLCVEAVLTLRKEYPRKTILFTAVEELLTGSEPVNEVSLDNCWLDRIVQIPCLITRRTMFQDLRRIMRAMLRDSDYVITYVYPQFQSVLAPQFADAKQCKHLTVCDVTNPDTHRFLQQCMTQLPEEQQESMRLRLQGLTYKAIGQQMNRPEYQAHDLVGKAGFALKKMTEQRYAAMEENHYVGRLRLLQPISRDYRDPREPSGTCGIIGFYNGDAVDRSFTDLFSHAFAFMGRCTIDRFLLESGKDTEAFTLYLDVLHRDYNKDIPFEILPDLGTKKANQEAMIQQSDMLICNSRSRKGLKQALQQAAKEKPMLIIDLGQQAEIIVRPDFLQRKKKK